MRVLCVAEKPSISKSISQILSGGQFRTSDTRTRYIKNYEFDYPQTNSIFTVTCVVGHLTSNDFPESHRKWNSCDPFELFDASVTTMVDKDKKTIEENLLTQARRADTLMIWTDCDREGEHIGLEVYRVCRKAKPNIIVKRARFSAIIAQQIHHAAQHPVELDRAQADAVEARIILDLKIGAAFTRMQTQILQARFGQIADGNNVVSYGPCQFPTLGFVVQKWNLVKSFVSEPFWYIYLSLTRNSSSQGMEETIFTWRRGHLFDADLAIPIYEYVLSNPTARVTKVKNDTKKKWKPLPLTTVELQKAGSRLLKLAPKRVLDIAEKLYQQGFLSYPRTETDQFDPQFDFHTLIQKQSVDPAWGDFATSLGQGGFSAPRKGKNNDKAHPPIHPTAHAGNLNGEEAKVYEFITRRFLACCSKDAEGWQTTVDVECGNEYFYATGLVVLEKNYLLVYPYDKWVGHVVPEFVEGEEFQPSVCELREGKTSKPNLLTEADLVTLMDKNGIGTDATIAQHIQTIIDRDYVIEKMEGATKYLIPSKLGIGLIEGYNQIGLNKSLSKPQLRRETERNMVQVCERTKTKADMVEEAINQYKELFIITKREFDKVISSVRQYLEGNGEHDNGNGNNDGHEGGPNGPDENPGGGRGRGNGSGRRGASRGRNPPATRGRGGRGGRSGGGARSSHSDTDSGDPPPRPQATRSNRGASATSSAQLQAGPSKDLTHLGRHSSASTKGTGTDVQCECHLPAAQRTVTKESASKGKLFWKCGNNDSCRFFKWVEDGPSTSIAPSIPTKRPYTSTKDTNSAEPSRICKCNDPAVTRTVTKETVNKGRKFWRCPHAPNSCDFFEWDDETTQHLASRPGTRTSSLTLQSAGPPMTTGECFKCNQSGHWANACPNDGDPVTKRSRSFASTPSSHSAICYKCQQEGHYSSECPQGGASAKSTEAPTNGQSCFNCGGEGHWSSACPNKGAPGKPIQNRSSGTKRGRGGGASRSKRGRGTSKRKSTFGAPD